MTTSTAWPVPFVIGPHNLAIDAVTAFVVSVLLACMVNAEAQAFASTFLGDSRVGAKDRFHFNAFLHLGILGSICYLVGGFGWPRTMEIDRSKFAHPASLYGDHPAGRARWPISSWRGSPPVSWPS